MHKKLLNEATFHLTISAEGPLLVKSGAEGWDPTLPDMQFVRTRHASLGETVFIPGSSLKGTVRSYSEKIARTMDVFCCDPFDIEEKQSATRFCGKRAEDAKKAGDEHVYRDSCAACRLYGSTAIAGRAAFADAYPSKPLNVATQLMKRTAVAIDRVLGSVAVGPFDFEALTNGEFRTHIRLRNFELWQLGLLGLAVRDLCLGRVRVGYGKSRGFGSVSATLDKLELRSIAADGLSAGDGNLSVKGIGALLSEEERVWYGIGDPENEVISIATRVRMVDDLIATSAVFERSPDAIEWFGEGVDALLSGCVKSAWKRYVQSHQASGGQHE